MANPRAFLILLAVLVCLVSLLGPACGAEFSSVSVINGASSSTTGITYVRGHSFRSETVRHHQRSIMILDGKEHMLWFLDPARKTYYGEKVPGEELAAKLEALTGMSPEAKARTAQRHGMSVRRLGTEKVAGYPCEKTVTEGSGFATTTWFSRRLEFFLREESTVSTGYGTATLRKEYGNVKERKLDPSLFRPPAGYTRVSPPARRTSRSAPKRGARAPAPSR